MHVIIHLFKSYKLWYIAPLDEMRDTKQSYNFNLYAHQFLLCPIADLIT